MLEEKCRTSLSAYWKYKVEKQQQDGSVVLVKDTPFTKNLIVNDHAIVAAGLFIGNTDFQGGAKRVEVGTGDNLWGGSPPSPLVTDTSLVTPLARKSLLSKNFLDEGSLPSVVITTTPSRFAHFTFILDFIEPLIDGSTIRELAFFGGNATDTLGTGHIINIIRPVPEFKDTYFKITYEVIMEFQI